MTLGTEVTRGTPVLTGVVQVGVFFLLNRPPGGGRWGKLRQQQAWGLCMETRSHLYPLQSHECL